MSEGPAPLSRLTAELSQLPGIQEVTSSIVLSDTKHTTALPI